MDERAPAPVNKSSEAKKESKQPIEIDVADFSSLIAGMSRLLIGTASIAPFKEANLGLAEWVALSVLAEKDGVSNKQLARTLGVTGQRANQVGASLKDAGLIAIQQSGEDSRKNEIKITEVGRSRYNAINEQLKPLLAASLKGREKSLSSASRQIKVLMRIVQVVNPDREKKKKKQKNAKGSDAAA